MNEPAPGARRPGIGFAICALGAVAVLLGLGTWQVDRLGWKRGLIAERRAMLARPPAAIANIAAAVAEFQPVRVTGTFRHDAELLVGPRARLGTPGWRVVTPLRLAGGGGVVLVDRGWVSTERKLPASRPEGQVAGETTVAGIARYPAAPGPFAPDNEPAKGQWFRVSPREMAAALRLGRVAPWWLAADDAPNPGGWPKGGGAVPMPPDNHLQYAITWYALALAAAVISVLFWRRSRRPQG